MPEKTCLTHKPEIIASSLQREALVTCGISPEVHAQTGHIIQKLGEVIGGNFLSVQLLGSRANGTASLTSDIDLALLAFDDEYPDVNAISGQIQQAEGVSCDPTVARTCLGITARIPSNITGFEWWAEDSGPFCLFNKGVLREQEDNTLTVLQLAATALQMQQNAATRTALWNRMKTEYNRAYLGDHSRITEKLKQRIGGTVETAITATIMNHRYSTFGLDESIETAHARLLRTVGSVSIDTVDVRAHDLYSSVRRQVAA